MLKLVVRFKLQAQHTAHTQYNLLRCAHWMYGCSIVRLASGLLQTSRTAHCPHSAQLNALCTVGMVAALRRQIDFEVALASDLFPKKRTGLLRSYCRVIAHPHCLTLMVGNVTHSSSILQAELKLIPGACMYVHVHHVQGRLLPYSYMYSRTYQLSSVKRFTRTRTVRTCCTNLISIYYDPTTNPTCT